MSVNVLPEVKMARCSLPIALKRSPHGFRLAFGLCLVTSQLYAYSGKLLHGRGVLDEDNIHQKMIPASVQKIITMYLAWNILGPNYRFATHMTELTRHRHYQINFTFDPTLTSKDLESLIQKLPKNTKILLDIVSNGLTQPHHPLWEKEDLPYCYASPIGPAILNENCVLEEKTIKVSRSKNPKHKTHHKQPKSKPLMTTKKITLSSPYNPYASLPGTIRKLCKKNQVDVQKVTWVMHESQGKKVATHYSAPVSKIMFRGLKNSNNLVMDSLWFASAQSIVGSKRMTWKVSANTLMAYLRSKHSSWGGRVFMSDGSGLSHHNRVSIATLNALLQSIEKNDALFKWSLDSFPTATVDGTMKHRFSRFKQQFKDFSITAKTGTLRRVRNYCGWVKKTNGKRLRFIWIENAQAPHALEHKHLQEDAIINFISPHIKSSNKPHKRD